MAEVIVVGAGPAGLAAAFRLQEAGHRVRVLEAAERAGSKLSSGERDGFVLDRGAFFVPTTHRHLLKLAGDIGLTGELVPGGFVFAAVRDGRFHRLDAGSLGRAFRDTDLISARAKLAAARLAPELLRARRATIERIEEAGRYDFESLRAWAERTQHPELVEALIEPAVRSMYATEIENLSRVEFLAVMALFGGAKLVAFREGMSHYSRELAARLDVATSSRVTAVEQTAGGADVSWVDSEGEHAGSVGGAVVAVAARTAAQVVRSLDDWRSAYLSRIPAAPLAIVSVALSRRPLETDVTYAMIGRREHPFLAGIGFNSNKAPGRVPDGKELLTLVPTAEWMAERLEDDDAAIVAAAIEGAEALLPGIAEHVEFAEVSRWTQQYPPVGHYAALGEFRARSRAADRTVHLCGEYLSAPQLSAATASGERAARELDAHLR